MFLRKFLPFLFCLLPLAAQAKSPLETLKDGQSRAEKLLGSSPKAGSPEAQKRRADLESEVKGLFDFEELAKRALGNNWKTASAEQQKEFVPLFSQPIIDNYLSQLEGRSSKGFSVTWGKETITGSEAVVESNVKGKTAEGKPVDINVKYFLIQKGSNWMVYDVVTDESSILEVQKETYKKAFKKEKTFDAVLTKLKSKTKK